MKSHQLMRIHVRGLEIDVQCGEGGIVDLAIRTHKKHRSTIGRVFQYIAHALYRAADIVDAGNNDSRARVIQIEMPRDAVDHCLANVTDLNIFLRLPTDLSNGDTRYKILTLYEGIEGIENGFSCGCRACQFRKLQTVGASWQVSADNFHSISPDIFNGREVHVDVDPHSATAPISAGAA